MLDLGEDLTLPADLSFAVNTGRPELIFDRELSREEQTCVLNLCRVLLKKAFEQQMDLEDSKVRTEDLQEDLIQLGMKLTQSKDLLKRIDSKLKGK